MDWQTLIFDPDKNWIARFDKIALKYFPNDESSAEAAVSEVLNRISENNYSKLNTSKVLINPPAYLTTVVTNLIRDIAISKYGKCRPPEWVKRMGEIWKQVHKLLCCHRQLPESITLSLSDTSHSVNFIANICTEIKQNHAKCGHEVVKPVNTGFDDFDENNTPISEKLGGGSLEKCINNGDMELLLNLISNLIYEQENTLKWNVGGWIGKLENKIQLEPQQILILKLVFQEQKSISDVARLLNIKRHVVDYQLKQALGHLKDVFQVQGIEFSN